MNSLILIRRKREIMKTKKRRNRSLKLEVVQLMRVHPISPIKI